MGALVSWFICWLNPPQTKSGALLLSDQCAQPYIATYLNPQTIHIPSTKTQIQFFITVHGLSPPLI